MKIKVLRSNELLHVEESLDIRGGFTMSLLSDCNCTSGNTNIVPWIPCPKNFSCSGNCSPNCFDNCTSNCTFNCTNNKSSN